MTKKEIKKIVNNYIKEELHKKKNVDVLKRLSKK